MKALLLASAAVLLLADVAAAQTAGQAAQPRPASPPGSDITRDLNSMPGDPMGTTRAGPATPPVIEEAEDEDEAESGTPPRATVTPTTPAPATRPPPRSAPPPIEEVEAMEDTPADPPVDDDDAASAPPEPAEPEAPPPPPSLTRVAVADAPFDIDLPAGFQLYQRPAGPDAAIYEVRRRDRGYVVIYAGCCSQFPIFTGRQVEATGRFSVVTSENGEQHAVEHLFQREDAPEQIHVWVSSVPEADRATAEAIAQSVDPR
ncbi:hypothetical protein [Brevundimonas sp.]|uniref:hypothetical protein n=1 Tax=Brevundimonas sp. TaxID=1871086 RepID=UPI0035B03FF0